MRNRLSNSKHTVVFLLVLFLFNSCNTINIIEKPIVFNELRDSLTIDYLNERYELDRSSTNIIPKMIVVHWTAIPTLKESFDAFNAPTLPDSRPEISGAGNLNVSAHFLVDRNGKIYRLMPETKMARHVIGLNHCAIGIENVGSAKNPLTDAQLKSNIKLVRYLKSKYDIDYLIGHYQYTDFEGHELWLEVDDGYRTEKTDPGEDFLFRLGQATKDLRFKTTPLPKS